MHLAAGAGARGAGAGAAVAAALVLLWSAGVVAGATDGAGLGVSSETAPFASNEGAAATRRRLARRACSRTSGAYAGGAEF